MQRIWQWLSNPPTGGPAAILLLRLMTGAVFFWEGILKFVYPNQGVGRFTKIGIPFPVFSAHFVGSFEIAGGALLMLGLFTRFVSPPFVFQMMVAVLSTKIALFLGTSPLALPPVPPQVGIWAVLHEIRSDYAQIVTCVFFAIVGPGPLSLDALLVRLRRRRGRLAEPGGRAASAHPVESAVALR
jgi:putative oxidoreductase